MKYKVYPFRERLKNRGPYVRLADYVKVHIFVSPLPLDVQKRLRTEMIIGSAWWDIFKGEK